VSVDMKGDNMKSMCIATPGLPRRESCLVITALLCLLLIAVPATRSVASTDYWELGFGPTGTGGVMGAPFGVAPWGSDVYDGSSQCISTNGTGIFLALYREHSDSWGGETGFYPGWVDRTPISGGGSITWGDFYLWSHNFTPNATNLVHIGPGSPEDFPPAPPSGYVGHLVLEQTPAGYSGPSGYWLDLTRGYDLALPIPVVSDPLQGTRFHLTVYAPVPEPSSILALGLALAGMGAMLRRRR
jgi:hypothetical protein